MTIGTTAISNDLLAFFRIYSQSSEAAESRRPMNSEVIKEVLHTLFSHLEKLETHTEALMQFMKEKEQVTDAQLAPYLEKAGNASNVRWRAARVRIEYLLSEAEMDESREREKNAEQAKSAEPGEKPEKVAKKSSTPSGMEQVVAADQKKASTTKVRRK